MSEFRKGQLMAARDADDCEWKLLVYDREEDGRHYCIAAERECVGKPICWAQVAPAEIIWPNLFLSVDQLIRKELVKQSYRHERQVQWLCKQLQAIGDRNGYQECPPVPFGDCRIGSCAACWEQASVEAVTEEDADDVR